MSFRAVVTGDEALEALARAAEAVDSPRQIRREASACVEVTESLYRVGFGRQEAPDGSRWKAPKRDYGHPLMLDTRALMQDATVTPEATGLRIDVPAPYAHFHQDGTKHMEARKIVPDVELGPRWDAKIGEARAAVKPEGL